MARLGFSTNSWREYFDSPNADSSVSGATRPGRSASPNIDGGYVVTAAGGSGKSGIYMVQPKYQFIANGAYQFPYQIDFGVSYLIRQGYPMPWYQATTEDRQPAGSDAERSCSFPTSVRTACRRPRRSTCASARR